MFQGLRSGEATVMKKRILVLIIEYKHRWGAMQRERKGKTDLRRTQSQDTADSYHQRTFLLAVAVAVAVF